MENDRAAASKLFTISGWSGSGKTTFIEKLIPELTGRGMSVGVIKHHGHDAPMSAGKKDSDRFALAGAGVVAVSSPREYIVHRRPERERTLLELAEEISDDCDVMVAESFKLQAVRPIELCRAAVAEKPAIETGDLFALVTDSPKRAREARDAGVEVLGLDEFDRLADMICLEIGWG